MNIKKCFSLPLAITVCTLLLGGCGNNSSVADADINYTQTNIFTAIPNNVTYKDYTVHVEDDAIEGAKVTAYECNSSKELSEPGTYVLTGCVSKPTYITVTGGTIGDTNVTQTFPLILNTAQTKADDNFVVTPLTTLVADANQSEINETAAQLGISPDDIYKAPSEVKDVNMTDLLQKVNAIYLQAETDGAIANKLKFIQTVRSQIKDSNITAKDFNVTKVADNVEKVSQQKPSLFGLVFMGNLKDNNDILTQIRDAQHPKTISFLGLVFDNIIPNANIKIYSPDSDINFGTYTTTADEYGKWEFNLSDDQEKLIEDKNFIIMFEATDPKNNKIVLTSSMSSVQLRDIINQTKTLKITPTKSPDLIISNVTTAQNAILAKRGVFQSNDIASYENNITNIKTYHPDKLLKTAAVIKDVVDNNNTSLLGDSNNTYSFVVDNINDANDVNLSTTITDVNTTDIEKNITDNSMLNQQLNYVPTTTQVEEGKNTFETAAKNSGYTFYRLLAYYEPGPDGKMGTSDDVFVREYTKIVTAPGFYSTKTCYIKNDDPSPQWQDCVEHNITTANFSNGNYNVQNDGNITNYTLENNDSIYVPDLNKIYKIYEVSKRDMKGTDVVNNTPEVLVNNYDIVELFRLMESKDNSGYIELKELVKGQGRDEVNAELNRFVKDQIDNVKNIFKDNNTTN